MRIVDLNETTKRNLLSDLLKRDPNNYEEYAGVVQEIIDQVKEKGDEAVFAYTEKFDKARITGDNVRVTKAEIEEARAMVKPELLRVMERAMENIRDYHQKQVRHSWFDSREDGVILGQKQTGRGEADRYGDSARKRWKGESCHSDRGSSGRRHRGV